MKKYILFILILFVCFGCNKSKTITFVSDGKVVKTVDVNDFEEYIPEKENHNFLGWYLDKEYINEFTDELEINNNISLYAKWKEHTDISLFTFEVIGDEQLKIVDFIFDNFNDKVIILPDKAFGKKVTELGAVFQNNEVIEEIILPKDLKIIDDEAFSNMINLEKIILPKGLIKIGKEAFFNTKSLKGIVIPGSIEYLGYKTFMNSGIEIVRVEEGVTYIPESMFENCKSLILIDLPKSILEIDARAFYNCRSLLNIDIPNGVRKIEYQTFYGCNNLIEVSLPNSLEVVEYSAFENCRNFTVLLIPSNTRKIEKRAFYNNRFTTMILPDGILEMGDEAFFQAPTKTIPIYIYFQGKSIPTEWSSYWINVLEYADILYEFYPNVYN